MENLSHSRTRPSRRWHRFCTRFFWRPCFGGGGGSPPRFGATTPSPRVEDYNEIFGRFHSSSRASSIPVPDFAPSLEELMMMESNCARHGSSSDDAWIPAETDPPLEGTDDGHLDIDFTGEMLTGRHLRKTSASGPLFRSDVSSSRGNARNDSFTNESFITISDLSLRTQPSQLPPPSRPPPPLDVKMRDSGRSTPNCDGVSSEGKSGEISPPYFDVEVDASSSAAASTAATKKTMEKAQAKLKSAKELMVEDEKVKKEKLLELERLRKMEEQREREREREKDRMAVDQAALEAHERANRDKLSIGAGLKADCAAGERAFEETRECAFKKTMADMCEARVRIERSVLEKFSASSWNSEMRPSASSPDLQDQQLQASGSFIGSRYPYPAVNGSYHAERSEGVEGESAQRCKARLERQRRTAERVEKALVEKNMRDLLAQREQAERNRLAKTLDADVKRWSKGKEENLRSLLSTLQYILGPDSGWHPVLLKEVITSAAVKRAYMKATLCVHPDKLQQRGATIQQKYVCEKVFDLLKKFHHLQRIMVTSSIYRCLFRRKHGTNSTPRSGKYIVVVKFLGDEKRAEMEEKWKKLLVEELKLYVRKQVLLKGQSELMLAALQD